MIDRHDGQWGARVRSTPLAVLGSNPLVRQLALFVAGMGALEAFDRLILPHKVPPGEIFYGALLGTVYALLAIGLILVYQSNRIINFAVAEFGVFGAILYQNLRGQGRVPWILAVVVGISAAGVTAYLMEKFVARRFAQASRLILTVVTIGMAQFVAFGELEVSRHFGTIPASAGLKTPLSSFHFNIGGEGFDGNALLLLGMAVVILVALEVFLHRSDYGIALRAAAENGQRASLLGIPVRTVSTVAWVAAGLIAGIATVLEAPMTGVVAGGTVVGPTLLYKALAVAVIADFADLRAAVLAGVFLGALEQSITYSYSGSTVTDAVFVAITILVLLFRRQRVSRIIESTTSSWRAIREVRSIPREVSAAPRVRLVRASTIVVVGALVVLLPLVLDPSRRFDASEVLVFALVAISCVVVTGWSGQISLGQFALAAVGAVTSGKLFAQAHWDFLASMLAAGAVGAIVAMGLGAVAARVRGFLFAVTSLGFAIALESYLFNPRFFSFLIPSQGFLELNRPKLFGSIDLTGDLAYYYFSLVVVVALGLAVAAMRRSRTGRVLIATRDNDRAARSYGVSRARSLFTSFAVSGFIAGIAGCLFAFHAGAVAPGDYAASQSLTVFAMAVIGGLGSVSSAAVGATLIESWHFLFAQNQAMDALGTAAGLTIVLLVIPEGVGSLLYRLRDRALGRFAPDRLAAAVSSDEAPPPPAGSTAGASGHGRVSSGLVPGDPRLAQAPPPPPAVLACHELDVSYGQAQVLFGVDFAVHRGEMVALLGVNGAGKSTLLRAVCGLTRPGRGSVVLQGEDVSGFPPERIASRSISMVPGGRGVFPTLTVAENLRMAGWLHRRDRARVSQAVESVLSLFPVLRDRQQQIAGNLSGGEQQMLTLGQSFITQPDILVIDELSLGLAPVIVGQLMDVVRNAHSAGTTVVLVEQSLNLALELCDRAVFMEKGEVRFDGPAAELRSRPDLLRSVFLGSASAPEPAEHGGLAAAPEGPPEVYRPGDPIKVPTIAVEVRNITIRFGGIRALDEVSLKVHSGEILAVVGGNGAGKTTLFDVISGFAVPDSGRVLLGGRNVTGWSPARRANAGLGRSFQDALLFSSLTVRDTVAVALDRSVDVRDPVSLALGFPVALASERSVRERVDELVAMTGLEPYVDKFLSELSTGSRRMVDLACSLAHEPDVLLLDEPAAGIAQRETEALGPVLTRIRDERGIGLLVVEHDMPLIRAIADRVVVLEAGAVIAEGTADEVMHDERVIASYLGGEIAAIERSGDSPGAPPPNGPDPLAALGELV